MSRVEQAGASVTFNFKMQIGFNRRRAEHTTRELGNNTLRQTMVVESSEFSRQSKIGSSSKPVTKIPNGLNVFDLYGVGDWGGGG